MSGHHLILSVPTDWSNDAKGDFFEEFVLEILRPMRLRAERRLRVTGMEIDILAKGEDRPFTVLVECKAYRDPVPADVITKLLGNVKLRRADQGWLFSTSDLTKDGRGLWQEIQEDEEHAKSLVWYSPSRTIDVLIAQRSVVDPATLLHRLTGHDLGDWTLVASPSRRAWLVELLEDGLPTKYCAFDARDETPGCNGNEGRRRRFSSVFRPYASRSERPTSAQAQSATSRYSHFGRKSNFRRHLGRSKARATN